MDQVVNLQHLLTIESLPTNDILALIKRGQAFKNGAKSHLSQQPYFVANLFFENSTRTHKSFEIAEKNLD